MWILGVFASCGLIFVILGDCFETILQPRRVTHRYRFARAFYRVAWGFWRTLALRISLPRRRDATLSIFAPLSLLALFATWVTSLIFGFGILHWSLATPLHASDSHVTLGTYLYFSGTTFFTLGYGDVTPLARLGQALAVVESGLGFAFLAVIIGYLPVLYQAYSRREVTISLLDARAGSPPTAAEFLLRLARSGSIAMIDPFLAEWEQWAAELLESHLSFPVLSYYRSQHENQSWLAALVCMLDTCVVLMAEVKSHNSYRAQLTFAMARHSAVDLSLVLKTAPIMSAAERATASQRHRVRELLREAGVALHDEAEADARLVELRSMYEPFVAALAQRFLLTLPPLLGDEQVADNWQRSAWMRRTPGIGSLPVAAGENDHFD